MMPARHDSTKSRLISRIYTALQTRAMGTKFDLRFVKSTAQVAFEKLALA